MTTAETIKNLNENERRAMRVICSDCDEIDGYGFTRPIDMVIALVNEFKNGNVAGGYITDLIDKNLIEVDVHDDTVWVEPDVYEEFC